MPVCQLMEMLNQSDRHGKSLAGSTRCRLFVCDDLFRGQDLFQIPSMRSEVDGLEHMTRMSERCDATQQVDRAGVIDDQRIRIVEETVPTVFE